MVFGWVCGQGRQQKSLFYTLTGLLSQLNSGSIV